MVVNHIDMAPVSKKLQSGGNYQLIFIECLLYTDLVLSTLHGLSDTLSKEMASFKEHIKWNSREMQDPAQDQVISCLRSKAGIPMTRLIPKHQLLSTMLSFPAPLSPISSKEHSGSFSQTTGLPWSL